MLRTLLCLTAATGVDVAAGVGSSCRIASIAKELDRLRETYFSARSKDAKNQVQRAVLSGPLAALPLVLLSGVGPSPPPPCGSAVVDMDSVAADNSKMNCPEVMADFLASCALFDCEDTDLINALVHRIAAAPVGDLPPHVIARTATSCAKLGFVNDAVLKRLINVAERKVTKFDGRSAGLLLVALGRFNMEGAPIFARLMRVLTAHGALRHVTAREALDILFYVHGVSATAPGIKAVNRRALARALCSVVVRRFDAYRRLGKGERVRASDLNFAHQAALDMGLSLPWLDDALLRATKRTGVIVDHGGDTTIEDSVHYDSIAVDKIKLQGLMAS